MAGIKVGNVDVQFGKEYDQAKANQLVQSLQQTVGAVNALANQAVAPTPPSVAVHVLATQAGLGVDHTVAGLEIGQTLIAESSITAHFGFLTFGQLAQTDPGSFASAGNGDIIAFVDGYWSAVPNTLGLVSPGADALLFWDITSNGGAGGLTWALPGTGIKFSPGSISVDDTQLHHGELQGLLADDHPQYALVVEVPLLTTANVYTALQTFTVGLTSDGDIDLTGNLEQFGIEGVEQRIRNTNDLANEGTWRMHVEPGQQMYAAVNDDGSDGETWLSVQRVGELVDTVALEASYLTFNGFDVCCGTLVPGAGPAPPTIAGYLTVTVGGQTIKVPYLSS